MFLLFGGVDKIPSENRRQKEHVRAEAIVYVETESYSRS